MPLSKKGEAIKAAMAKTYGKGKGEQVFYASARSGKITGVEKDHGGSTRGSHSKGKR